MNSLLTRASLLLRLRDTDADDSWREFVRLYAPLVEGYCRRRGLQAADASDVTQDVLTRVARSISRFDYDPQRGTFRGWLFRVVRHRLSDFYRAAGRRPLTGGGSAVQDALAMAPDRAEEADWERLHCEQVLQWATRRARAEFQDSTWQSFYQTSIEGHSVEAVASELGISKGAVYIARSRVHARLSELLEEGLA